DNSPPAACGRLFYQRFAQLFRNRVKSVIKVLFSACQSRRLPLIFVPVVTHNVAFIAQLVRAPP
ncbi:hypothetical protein, partial [Pseudescherichia sp.]|uniref:hypothetical protein n=1 Tax=Pseudescherichia sp. TaxID=2055881 RepID=UPI0028A93BB9